MGQLLHTCWEKSRCRFFRHCLHCRFTRKMVEHILKKTCPKTCQKVIPQNRKKTEKKRGGLEGVLGGLGAFLEPCRAGLDAEAQKCTREVPKFDQLGGILGVKLVKSLEKSSTNWLTFWFFFEAFLGAKMVAKSFQNGCRSWLQDAFQGARKRQWWKCDFEQH